MQKSFLFAVFSLPLVFLATGCSQQVSPTAELDALAEQALLGVAYDEATPEDLQKILDKRVCSLQEEARAFFWQPVAGEKRSLVRLVSLTASKFRKAFVQQ